MALHFKLASLFLGKHLSLSELAMTPQKRAADYRTTEVLQIMTMSPTEQWMGAWTTAVCSLHCSSWGHQSLIFMSNKTDSSVKKKKRRKKHKEKADLMNMNKWPAWSSDIPFIVSEGHLRFLFFSHKMACIAPIFLNYFPSQVLMLKDQNPKAELQKNLCCAGTVMLWRLTEVELWEDIQSRNEQKTRLWRRTEKGGKFPCDNADSPAYPSWRRFTFSPQSNFCL